MSLFGGIGVLLGGYTLICALSGTVHAKRGLSMETIERAARPGYFWTVVCIYGGLSMALLTVL